MTGAGDYHPEAGRRATGAGIVDVIERAYNRLGLPTDRLESNRDTSLSWDDPRDRERVRQKFDDLPDNEALLPGFGPDGFGENARDDCGEPHPFLCHSCGNPVEFGRTCSMSVCARCGVAWVRDRAIQKAAKMRRVRKEKYQSAECTDETQKFHHQVISPPLFWWWDLADAGLSIEEAREETKRVVKEILAEQRAQGIVIRHSYRGENDDGSVRDESDDTGLWKERINSMRAFFGDVRDELAWMPHYHTLVATEWLKGGKVADPSVDDGHAPEEPALSEHVETETGWVLARIARDDGTSIENDRAMARALTYSLSHLDVYANDDANNQAGFWTVGSFEGDGLKNSSRFTPTPADLEWADNTVRDIATEVLGLKSGTTDCGATIPPVDDPDELARRIVARIYEDLYPDDTPPGRDDVNTDSVLHDVAEGDIRVSVSSTNASSADLTVTDANGNAFGSTGADTGSDGIGMMSSAPTFLQKDADLPEATDRTTYSADETPGVDAIVTEADDLESTCGCDDHDDAQQHEPSECDGTLIPLEQARERGLLEDPEWCRNAAHVDEARELDREWPDDLDPWRTTTPDGSRTIGVG